MSVTPNQPPTQTSPQLTVFYDGHCPLCMKEIRYLQGVPKAHQVQFEDCKADDFVSRYPDLDLQALDAKLHVRLRSGQWVYGLDATLALWQALGKGHWLAPLRWPGLYQLTSLGYRFFARHRHALSRRLFPSTVSCDSNTGPKA